MEKSSRERILDVRIEVDNRPVSSFGCDGVLCATPTGSTAYAFSAGGPVVWPDVQALLVVPSNAHAMFARPLVVSPKSRIAVEVDPSGHPAVLCCDGRRTFVLPPGARVEVVRRGDPGAAREAAAGAVHRPSGGEVRAARPGLAQPTALNRTH